MANDLTVKLFNKIIKIILKEFKKELKDIEMTIHLTNENKTVNGEEIPELAVNFTTFNNDDKKDLASDIYIKYDIFQNFDEKYLNDTLKLDFEFLKNMGCKIDDVTVFILLLLHEIGHTVYINKYKLIRGDWLAFERTFTNNIIDSMNRATCSTKHISETRNDFRPGELQANLFAFTHFRKIWTKVLEELA